MLLYCPSIDIYSALYSGMCLEPRMAWKYRLVRSWAERLGFPGGGNRRGYIVIVFPFRDLLGVTGGPDVSGIWAQDLSSIRVSAPDIAHAEWDNDDGGYSGWGDVLPCRSR